MVKYRLHRAKDRERRDNKNGKSRGGAKSLGDRQNHGSDEEESVS